MGDGVDLDGFGKGPAVLHLGKFWKFNIWLCSPNPNILQSLQPEMILTLLYSREMENLDHRGAASF